MHKEIGQEEQKHDWVLTHWQQTREANHRPTTRLWRLCKDCLVHEEHHIVGHLDQFEVMDVFSCRMPGTS